MEQNNIDVKTLSREQLEAEYERSQWVLGLLLRRFGEQRVSIKDWEEAPAEVRIWYTPIDRDNYTVSVRPHCSKLEQA